MVSIGKYLASERIVVIFEYEEFKFVAGALETYIKDYVSEPSDSAMQIINAMKIVLGIEE